MPRSSPSASRCPYALTPNTVELIPALEALCPPGWARPGPSPRSPPTASNPRAGAYATEQSICNQVPLNNYFTLMCSGSEAGLYLRLIDFVYHSTLGLVQGYLAHKNPPPCRTLH